jgi:DNA replicative helicase MCM subunit Mcm2 (Cdc46/Mcm family)
MLNQYHVNIRQRFGSPRILNTILEIAKNIARLKLKQEIDENDAKETMHITIYYFNWIKL